MTDDLLKRLRFHGYDYYGYGLYNEAADRIDQLTDRINELEQGMYASRYELVQLLEQALVNMADVNATYGALVVRHILGRDNDGELCGQTADYPQAND